MSAKLGPDSKIYVAGHRGLLGSAVYRRLEREGCRNIITRKSAELDLRDEKSTFKFLESERPEFVFLCAAKVGGIKANMEALADFYYDNVRIQNNVIEGSRRAGVKKLLFVGSSCIYPKEAPCPIREDSLLTGPLEPTNEGYAIAKIAGIKMCEFYRKQHGCDFISAQPTNLFGINDNYDLQTSHVLPAIIRKVHEAKGAGEKELVVWGSGKPRREFLLSDDAADALVFLMRNYSGDRHVNVGTGEDVTILEMVRTVIDVLEAKLEIKLDPSRPDGTMRKVMDVTRINAMGWQAKTPLREGIKIAYRDFLEKIGSTR
jgi:GDP-L-fucose synthase